MGAALSADVEAPTEHYNLMADARDGKGECENLTIVACSDCPSDDIMGDMRSKSKKTTPRTGHKSLGRSALTGTRILRPAARGATISFSQVRSALRALSLLSAK